MPLAYATVSNIGLERIYKEAHEYVFAILQTCSG